MTPLELLLILLSPFTVLGIHAHRVRLAKWLKAAWRKAEEWTKPPAKVKP